MRGLYNGVFEGIRENLPLIAPRKDQLCLAGSIADFQANLSEDSRGLSKDLSHHVRLCDQVGVIEVGV